MDRMIIGSVAANKWFPEIERGDLQFALRNPDHAWYKKYDCRWMPQLWSAPSEFLYHLYAHPNILYTIEVTEDGPLKEFYKDKGCKVIDNVLELLNNR